MFASIATFYINVILVLSDEILNETIENSSSTVAVTEYENISFEISSLLNESDFNYTLINDNFTNLTEINSLVTEEIDDSFKWNLYNNYLSYTMPDENICVCDLSLEVCDINCCCDLDCSEDDIKVFSKCDPQIQYVDENYCYFTDIILRNSTIYQVQVNPKNGLLCIVHNNLKQYLRFKDLPNLSSHRDLELMLKYQSKEVYSWDANDKKRENFRKILKAGNSIYINSSYVEKAWYLPSPCFTGLCSCDKKVLYLEDFSSSCIQTITNFEEECEKNDALSASSYVNFCISFQKSIQSNLFIQSKIFDSVEEPYSEANRFCLSDSEKKPHFSKNTCYNIINSIHFTVLHKGIFGIIDIIPNFEYINITFVNYSFTQNFKVTFKWHNSSDTMKKSGNPGYLIGLPILIGINSTHSAEEPYKLDILTDGLSVFGRDSRSHCSHHKRQSVKFGKNLKTSCYLKLTEANCKVAQDKIYEILLNTRKENLYVGVFGNANESNSDDWIEAYYNNDEIPNNEDSCNLLTGIKINVVYASVGTVQNPQFKILGLGYRYTNLKEIGVPCGQKCEIILTSSVSFFDVSEPPLTHYPNIPTLKANLPTDFFYPFLQGS